MAVVHDFHINQKRDLYISNTIPSGYVKSSESDVAVWVGAYDTRPQPAATAKFRVKEWFRVNLLTVVCFCFALFWCGLAVTMIYMYSTFLHFKGGKYLFLLM